MTPVEVLQESVSVKLEENSNLSNGIAISYAWDVDEEFSKYIKCKIKYKNDTFAVSGLTEVGTFDAFAGLEIEFSGVAPETVVVEEEEIAESGYILPNSDTELLTRADLEGLSAEECKLARNEIYARHGRKFKDEALQAYFDSCDWYEGTIDPDDFQETYLSDIEIANKDIIVEYEEEKGYR